MEIMAKGVREGNRREEERKGRGKGDEEKERKKKWTI